MTLRARTLIPLAVAALAALAPRAEAQPGPGPLFPEPFRVTHHLVQEDGDGSRFVGEPVVDTYGGSWIVSQRPDGSRLIVDLDRRELSGIDQDKGVFWTVSFDRFAELQARLGAAQGLAPAGAFAAQRTAVAPAAELVVSEITTGEAKTGEAERGGQRRAAAPSLGAAEHPGVKQLRVSRRAGATTETVLDVWVDPSVRLTPAALSAVGSLESVLASPKSEKTGKAAAGPASLPLAAARAHAGGAFPVRTLRPIGRQAGRVEDLTTRLDRLERFPSELAEIPEGLRRVPHPLEAVVRFLEEERVRDRALAGRTAGANGQSEPQ